MRSDVVSQVVAVAVCGGIKKAEPLVGKGGPLFRVISLVVRSLDWQAKPECQGVYSGIRDSSLDPD